MVSAPIPRAVDVAIALNAVIATVEDEQPLVLSVDSGADAALPYGPFDPERHRTFEIGMREWVEKQTSLSLGYVEQLYTFGDKGREAPTAALAGRGVSDRIVSVGYLALAPSAADVDAAGAKWRDWYAFFPWEDWRAGAPPILTEIILPALNAWVTFERTETNNRRNRIAAAFGASGGMWEEERTLDRYELMYEAGLVVEARRDGKAPDSNSSLPELGQPMLSDHRRILATAIGRIRGKLKYRPVLFQMMPPSFTLLQLQRTVEAIVGFSFHKQNFRRSVEKSGFVVATGETVQQTSGRPAALFEVNREGVRDRAAAGLTIPRMRLPDDF